MKSPEVVYFEGLPKAGKTSITRKISSEYPSLVLVPEYVHPALEDPANWDKQFIFTENDEMKYQIARNSGKQCLVDRGHLSTLLYTHAYNLIRGDKDLRYVDDWYMGTIIKKGLLPDYYVYMDIPPEVSLARRTLPLDDDNMWDHIEALKFARDNYPRYMGMFEPSVPLLTLSSGSLTIEEMKIEVIHLLGLENSPIFTNI